MFDIYSIGDAAFLEQVLIGLALVTNQLSFIQMAMIACLLGVCLTAFDSIMNGGKAFNIHHTFLGMILFMMFFVPKVTVVIEDAYTGDLRPVADVPIGPAAAGSLISNVGLGITDMFEFSYGIIAPGITESAFLDSLQLLTESRKKLGSPPVFQALDKANGVGTDIRMSINNYVRECTAIKLQREQQNTSVLSEENLLDAIKYDHNAYETMLYLAGGPQQYTCSEGYTKLAAALAKVDEDDVMAAVGSMMGMKEIADGVWPGGETPFDKIDNSFRALDMLGASATAAKDYTLAAVIEPIFYEALQGSYSDIQDTSAAIMVNQAIQQRNTQWATEQSLFMSTVRPLMAFFEAFVFGIAPIAAFIMLLGQKGIALAGKYLMLILFIQLWYPILSLTNLYIYMAAASEMGSYDLPNWTSLYGLQLGTQVIQTWIATGGMLAASTPMLAMMLLYGSAYTATSLAGRMSSADHVNERITTPDAITPGAYMQDASRYMHNDATGSTRVGMEGTIDQFNMASSIGSSLRSDNTSSLAHSSNAMQTLMSGLTKTGNSQSGFNAATTMGRDIVAGTGSSFDSTAKQAFEHAKSQGASDEVAYATASYVYGQAQGGLNLSKMLSGGSKNDAPKKAENSDESVVEQAAKHAGNFWNKFGGTDSKSNSKNEKNTPEESGNEKSGNPATVTASAVATAGLQIRDADTYTNGDKINTSDSQSQGIVLSEQENAKIARSIMAKTDESEQQTYSKALSETDSESFSQSANTARLSIASYSQSYELNQNLGSSQTPTARELFEALERPNLSNPESGNYGDMLNREFLNQQSINQNSSQLNNAIRNKQNALMTNNRMPAKEAQTIATFTAFNNPLNFTDKDGNLDHNSYNSAREVAGRALAGALGNPYVDSNPFANQGLPKENDQYVPTSQDEANVRSETDGNRGLTDQKGKLNKTIEDKLKLGATLPTNASLPGQEQIKGEHNKNLDKVAAGADEAISSHHAPAYADAHENLRKRDDNPDLYSGGDFEGVKMVASVKDALATAQAGVTGLMRAAEVTPAYMEEARDALAGMTKEEAKQWITEADQSRDETGAMAAETLNGLYERITGEQLTEGAQNAISAIGSASEGGAQTLLGFASQPFAMSQNLSGPAMDMAGHSLTQDEVNNLNDDLGEHLYRIGAAPASDMFNGDAGIVKGNNRNVIEGGGNSALGYFMYSTVMEPAMNDGKEAFQQEMTARTNKMVDDATTGWGVEGTQEKALFSAYMHGDEAAMNTANQALIDKYSDEHGNLSDSDKQMLDGMNHEMSDAAKTGQHGQINLKDTHALVMAQKSRDIEPNKQ